LPHVSPTPTATPAPTASPTPTPTVPPRLAARLEKALERAKTSLHLPGVEATVLFPDGSSWTGTLGYADVAEKRRVTATTPFAIASVTKTFTAALILRYVDQGQLDLDDRLSRWVPDWPNAKRITIRMLLNHTSGIPDFFQNPKFEKALNKHKKRTWEAADVLAEYVRPGVVFAPGAGWSYSNTNYVLLGMVAERIGDAPWDVLVHRELLAPLGLTSTYVQGVDEPAGEPAIAYRIAAAASGGTKAVARTDGTAVVPFTSVVTAAGSAGAMASTTRDLARWAKALYGGHLLTRETRKEMLTFVKAYAYGLGTRYGLGVSRVRMQDRIAYGHTGALAGTRASIRYFPKEKVAIAVVFNRETFVGDDVTRILARTLFPKPPESPAPSPTTAP
jgi:D-alanyl-D-alanine carboxypeptidase